MPITLYDLTVPTFLQSLEGAAGVLEKGLAHCQATGTDPDALLEARLVEDMRPLRFQVQSMAQHSRGALEGAQAGVFSPFVTGDPTRYADLQALVAETRSALATVKPEAVNALEGRDVEFRAGEHRVPFTVETFLMSVSLPNFFFHATTAYDILRARGVGLVKSDYLGPTRQKR